MKQLSEEKKSIVEDIRTNWAISDKKRDEGLQIPDDITAIYDISYGPYGDENLLDIYSLKSASGLEPAIVNIHGGAWVYGCKEIYKYYCMSLAQHGFKVVNINYRLAPESVFPAAQEDINAVLTFIEKHGAEYGIDKDRLILVGDSAGGQLVSHYAAILTNPELARLFDFKLPDVTVGALGLNCGAYNERSMLEKESDNKYLIHLGIEAGEQTKELLDRIDTPRYINENYPPTYVMSSYEDFLLNRAEPMYKLIESRGVPARIKIYGNRGNKEIGHVFHVNCKLEEARLCNDDQCQFFKQYV